MKKILITGFNFILGSHSSFVVTSFINCYVSNDYQTSYHTLMAVIE